MLCHTQHKGGAADTYEQKNAAQGPHRGTKLVSAKTGAAGVGRLQAHHRLRHFTKALDVLGVKSQATFVIYTGQHSSRHSTCQLWYVVYEQEFRRFRVITICGVSPKFEMHNMPFYTLYVRTDRRIASSSCDRSLFSRKSSACNAAIMLYFVKA